MSHDPAEFQLASEPAATVENGPAGVVGSGDLFGVCACGTRRVLSSGWVPSYNDPDNSSGAPEAEPFCPKCAADFERENLRNYEHMSRSATRMPLRPIPGTVEYDIDTENLLEAAEAMRNSVLVSPNVSDEPRGEKSHD